MLERGDRRPGKGVVAFECTGALPPQFSPQDGHQDRRALAIAQFNEPDGFGAGGIDGPNRVQYPVAGLTFEARLEPLENQIRAVGQFEAKGSCAIALAC